MNQTKSCLQGISIVFDRHRKKSKKLITLRRNFTWRSEKNGVLWPSGQWLNFLSDSNELRNQTEYLIRTSALDEPTIQVRPHCVRKVQTNQPCRRADVLWECSLDAYLMDMPDGSLDRINEPVNWPAAAMPANFPPAYHYHDELFAVKTSIGHMDTICESCSASRYSDEYASLCCNANMHWSAVPPPAKRVWFTSHFILGISWSRLYCTKSLMALI